LGAILEAKLTYLRPKLEELAWVLAAAIAIVGKKQMAQ
jgi:hypothetical protein